MRRPEQRSTQRWMVLSAAVASLCLVVAACQSPPQQSETTAPPAAQTPPSEAPPMQAQHYELKGKVVAVDLGRKKLTVDHENIPGFMGAMTMPYQVKDAAQLENLAPGVRITATVVSGDGQYWLEDVKAAPPN